MTKQLDVLVVDDNDADSEIIQRHLEDVQAFEVSCATARTHDESIEAVENQDFDVIFMDYKLPDQSGLTTVGDIRNRDVKCPVIMLTGQGSERLAAIAMREGADDYLTKDDLTPTSLQYSINHVINEKQRNEELQQKLQDLQRKSELDELTGLYNRRALEAHLKEEMKRTKRYDIPLCLLMLDMDNFKEINDTHGHIVGDEVLEAASWLLLDNIRESDILARYGGDEFCIIATGSNIDEAEHLGRRILEEFESRTFELVDGGLACTFSLGIAEYSRELDLDVEAFLHEADKAMYLAKKLGRGEFFTVRSSSNEDTSGGSSEDQFRRTEEP